MSEQPDLPALAPEDKARLEAEGKAAAKLAGQYLAPIALALITGNPIAWAEILLPLLGQISKLITANDVMLALRYLVAFGKISIYEAKLAAFFLHEHAPNLEPLPGWAFGLEGGPSPAIPVDASGGIAVPGNPNPPEV